MKVVILGSANSIPDEEHENTYLAIVGEKRVALVDCVGSPVVRLKKAGIPLHALTDLVLTHFHPDHVSAVPLLLMDMWLSGRRDSFDIYGLTYTLDRLQAMMELYGWESWPEFFPTVLHHLPADELVPVLEADEFRIFSSPVCHLIPTLGLRVEFASGKVMAYSCDTEPCEQVVRLAQGADVLIHEATGAHEGHTSAAQAGEIAQRAGAKALYLIHYPVELPDKEGLVRQAQTRFDGPVALAIDFLELDFG
ncbi:MAG: MBL fold metallo-hydrolase [Anaerolineae bacterium]|nr:MAG: MBL fold metallo-hydrolase [Anaerolineae bacterium]